MQKSIKEKHPIKDGWLQLTVKLKKGVTVSQEDMILWAGLKEKKYEVGLFWHGKTTARIIIRKTSHLNEANNEPF
jgi:hypothetical protein